MICIKPLELADMPDVVALKILCWTEELAGVAENTLCNAQELEFWSQWMTSAQENNDVRLLIGAFENNRLLGAGIGSIAEPFDIPEKGIELNGLWVHPNHRGRGISLLLLKHLIDFYQALGMDKMVVYNHHQAPSNTFYPQLGALVVKQERQMNGRLLIDVFLADMPVMQAHIENRLGKYPPA